MDLKEAIKEGAKTYTVRNDCVYCGSRERSIRFRSCGCAEQVKKQNIIIEKNKAKGFKKRKEIVAKKYTRSVIDTIILVYEQMELELYDVFPTNDYGVCVSNGLARETVIRTAYREIRTNTLSQETVDLWNEALNNKHYIYFS